MAVRRGVGIGSIVGWNSGRQRAMDHLLRRLAQSELPGRKLVASDAPPAHDRLGPDVLPALGRVLDAEATRGGRCADEKAIARRLRAIACPGSPDTRLTRIDLGDPCPSRSGASADCRLAWWPDGLPTGRWIGVASSRLGRKLELRTNWFAALRSLCQDAIDAENDWLMAVHATAAGPFVRRAAELFHLNALSIDVCQRTAVGLGRWLDRVASMRSDCSTHSVRRVYVSRPIGGGGRSARPVNVPAPPARDRAVVLLSDQVWVLHVRPGGHIERLVRQRLADPAAAPGSVILAQGEGLVPGPLGDALLRLGAVAWEPKRSNIPRSPSDQRVVPPASTQRLPHLVPWPFLIHTTRRCDGAWPDQEEMEYLDDLILGRPAADHSAYATLERIVRQRRIRASGRAIRGGAEVVSFTSVAPDALLPLRVFRPHRRRWDFQRYGLCIRRDWLARRGARPVYYGDDALWRQLPTTERPFFQRRRSPGTGRQKPLVWTVEREWRHLGDIDLAELPPEAAWLFAATDAEVRRLAGISPWPVAKLADTISAGATRATSDA